MPEISIFNHNYQLELGESLLDGLIKRGVRLPYSCRAGVCQSCLLQIEEGQPPEFSQQLLNQQQIKKGYILACQARVSDNLKVKIACRDQVPATITTIKPVTPTRLLLTLSLSFPVEINKNTSHIRLDIAPATSAICAIQHYDQEKQTITVEIERKAGDSFSSWVHENTTTGERIVIRLV